MKNTIIKLMVMAALLQGSAVMGIVNIQKVGTGPFSYDIKGCCGQIKTSGDMVIYALCRGNARISVQIKGTSPTGVAQCTITGAMLTAGGTIDACEQFGAEYNVSTNTITLE